MPATAGRVRMPANNRVHSSAALQTHSIWQSAIGYDPYAPNSVNKEANNKGAPQAVPSSDPDAENAYDSFQGLLALARVTNSNADEARGCCKKCGRVGHLNFQCRNFLSTKDDKDKDHEAIEVAVLSGLDKVKGNRGKGKGRDGVESSEEEEEESESEDSDYDSDIERAIIKKYGMKKVSGLLKSSSRKKKDESGDDGVSDREERKKRGRSRKRRSGKKADSESGTEDERRHGRRGSRREKRRRRSHREVGARIPPRDLIDDVRGAAGRQLRTPMLANWKILVLVEMEQSILKKRAGSSDTKERSSYLRLRAKM